MGLFGPSQKQIAEYKAVGKSALVKAEAFIARGNLNRGAGELFSAAGCFKEAKQKGVAELVEKFREELLGIEALLSIDRQRATEMLRKFVIKHKMLIKDINRLLPT